MGTRGPVVLFLPPSSPVALLLHVESYLTAVCPTPPPLWSVIWVNGDRNKCSALTLGNQTTCQTYSTLPRTGTPRLAYSKYVVLLLHPVQKACCFRSAGSPLIPSICKTKRLRCCTHSPRKVVCVSRVCATCLFFLIVSVRGRKPRESRRELSC